MKNLKTYSHKGVDYRYSQVSQKWEFQINAIKTTFLTPVPGKSEAKAANAEKIASILAGAAKRAGAIDGLARNNISRIVGF